MRRIETIHSKVLRPFLDKAVLGAQAAEEILDKNGLASVFTNRREFEVPRYAICRAMSEVSASEDDPTFLYRAVMESSAGKVLPVANSQSVIETLCEFTEDLNGIATGVAVWWEIDQQNFWFKRSLDTGKQTEDFEVELGALAIFLRFLKTTMPGDSKPAIVHTRQQRPDYGGRISRIADKCVYGGNRDSAVAIPLDRLLPPGETDPSRWLRDRFDGADQVVSPGAVRKRLEKVVSAYVAVGDASVEKIAGAFGMSARTFRRRVQESCGFDYRSLVMNCRMSLATEQLGNSALKVGDISVRLGYANQGDFTRAFRKHTGLSPLEFRTLTSSRVSPS